MKKALRLFKKFLNSKKGLLTISIIGFATLLAIPLIRYLTFYGKSEIQDVVISEYILPETDSGLRGITQGPDGNIWFTEVKGNKIGKITPSGDITEYSLQDANSNPHAIVTGPDGNLWFTEKNNNKIAKISLDGVVTEFPLPNPHSNPNEIIVGPDNALWFTEQNLPGRIGRITIDGAITEFPVVNYPGPLVLGPDNNIWFSDGYNIYKMLPTGETTQFPVPTSNGNIYDMVVGSDSNIWFSIAAIGSGRVVKITIDGEMTEYPFSGLPFHLAADKNGVFWFTQAEPQQDIGSLTLDGETSSYKLPSQCGYPFSNPDPCNPYDIVQDSEGTIWFTMADGNRIGKLTYSNIPPTSTPAPSVVQSPTPTQTPEPSGTVTPTPIVREPIVLIPGIMGSEFEVKQTFYPGIKNCIQPFLDYDYIQGDKIWLESDLGKIINRYIICGNYLDVVSLQSDGQTNVYGQIGLKGTIINSTLPGNGQNIGYHDILLFFEQQGYQIDQDLFFLPYDWRKDLSQATSSLDEKINTALSKTGSDKVQIVAHSMGGLVARDYIRDNQHAQKVDTLIELGTPHAGTPTFLAHLLYNKCIKLFNLVCAVNGEEVRKLIQNFPGALELLPSKIYYQLYPYPNYPFQDIRDIDDNSITGVLDYNQTKTMLSNLDKNMTVFNIAENYHDILDPSYSNTNGVKTYQIIGSGHSTIGQINEYNGITLHTPLVGLPSITFGPKQDADVINGDNTVPVLSASLGQQNNVYFVNQPHDDLPTGTALQMMSNLLYGQTSVIPGVQNTPFNFNGNIVSVYSPVELHAYDSEGNHTGPKPDGVIEESIPGSSYDELGESKFIYVPDGGQYRFATKATGEGSFDLKIKTYEDSSQTKELLYLTVPQTENTTTSLALDSDSPILKVDTDNNGTIDQNMPATSTITGNSLSDTLAPVTTPQASGAQGSNGWYKSDVSLTLASQDNLSGVLKTNYYFEGDFEIHEYTEPITISTEKISKIHYFSIDKAGNTEEPKLIEIKIDKTAPELTMQFDPNTKEAVGSGEDNTSGIDSVNQTNSSLTAKDKAGNISQFTFTTKKRSFFKIHNLSITIKSLKYNNKSANIPRTYLVYSWTLDKKTNTIKHLLQSHTLSRVENVLAFYNDQQSKTTIHSFKKRQRSTRIVKDGLFLIKLKSDNGNLQIVY